MSGWEQTHRRYRLVYAVAEDIARRGPKAVDGWRDKIDEEYGGMQGFLLDVRRRWHTAVEAYLDDIPMPEIPGTIAKANKPLWVLWSTFANHPLLADTARPTAQLA